MSHKTPLCPAIAQFALAAPHPLRPDGPLPGRTIGRNHRRVAWSASCRNTSAPHPLCPSASSDLARYERVHRNSAPAQVTFDIELRTRRYRPARYNTQIRDSRSRRYSTDHEQAPREAASLDSSQRPSVAESLPAAISAPGFVGSMARARCPSASAACQFQSARHIRPLQARMCLRKIRTQCNECCASCRTRFQPSVRVQPGVVASSSKRQLRRVPRPSVARVELHRLFEIVACGVQGLPGVLIRASLPAGTAGMPRDSAFHLSCDLPLHLQAGFATPAPWHSLSRPAL